jgi:hypothetical protein
MLDETDIQKLLRLKRHEQPPAGYHEKFLQDFHRRQRSEMLREPVWKIALERMGAFFSDHSMGRAAYGMATAAVLLVAGVASFNMLNSGAPGPLPGLASSNPVPSHMVADISPDSGARITLERPVTPQNPALPEPAMARNTDPHYVIDSRPVSYERPFSF